MASCNDFEAKYFNDNRVELYINLNNSQIGLPFDMGIGGHNSFKKLCAQMELDVGVNYYPIEKFVKHLPLQKILLIPPICGGHLSNKAVIELNRFLKRGGHIIVLGEHHNAYESSSELNKFLLGHGAQVINWASVNEHENRNSPIDYFWPKCKSDSLNCDGFRLMLSAGLYMDSSWQRFATSDFMLEAMSNICCKKKVGTGWLYYVGDSEIFWNLGLDNKECGDANKKFLLELMSEIKNSIEAIGGSGNQNSVFIADADENKTEVVSQKNILVFGNDVVNSESSYGLSSLYNFFAKNFIGVIEYDQGFSESKKIDFVLLLPGWVETDKDKAVLEQLLSSQKTKWIVVLDGQSDMACKPEDLFFDIWRLYPQLEYENKFYTTPFPTVEAYLDFATFGLCLISRSGCPYKVTYKGYDFYGATLFTVTEDESNNKMGTYKLGFANSKNCYAAREFLPPLKSGKKSFSFVETIPNGCYLLYRDEKKLIACDYEMICNQYYGSTKSSKLFLKELQKLLGLQP